MANPGLFFVYFRPFLILISISAIPISISAIPISVSTVPISISTICSNNFYVLRLVIVLNNAIPPVYHGKLCYKSIFTYSRAKWFASKPPSPSKTQFPRTDTTSLTSTQRSTWKTLPFRLGLPMVSTVQIIMLCSL